jgi:hypothetical protein
MPAEPAPAGDPAAGAPAKERRDCKSADCAFQAAAPKAAYSSDFAASLPLLAAPSPHCPDSLSTRSPCPRATASAPAPACRPQRHLAATACRPPSSRAACPHSLSGHGLHDGTTKLRFTARSLINRRALSGRCGPRVLPVRFSTGARVRSGARAKQGVYASTQRRRTQYHVSSSSNSFCPHPGHIWGWRGRTGPPPSAEHPPSQGRGKNVKTDIVYASTQKRRTRTSILSSEQHRYSWYLEWIQEPSVSSQ